MSIALATHELVKNFGGLRATDHVSLTIHTGARHALIGPNGAGKTTLINLLTGVLTPSQGTIMLEGTNITRLSQHARVQRGLVRTFQINQLFADMSPLQSLCLAVSERHQQGRDWWHVAGSNKSFVDEAEDILTRFGLSDVMMQQTRFLPYGKQRLLEIALAIACNRFELGVKGPDRLNFGQHRLCHRGGVESALDCGLVVSQDPFVTHPYAGGAARIDAQLGAGGLGHVGNHRQARQTLLQ